MTKKRQSSATAVRPLSRPWPWILLALNPLLIIGGVFHPDPYIKITFIAGVLGLTLLAWPWQAEDRAALRFSIPELCWSGYLLWAALAILWSASPVIAYERWAYLLLPTAGYMIARQVPFWRSGLFWNVFAGVALIVGCIGICMYLFAGTSLGFDWIQSAGRPSSTLSYRAYAGTYLALSLPFLVWLLVSRFARSGVHVALYSLALGATSLFLIYTRARSGWMGALGAVVVMVIAGVQQRRMGGLKRTSLLAGAAAAAVVLVLALLPPNTKVLKSDLQPQRLEGTGKETFVGTLANTFQLVTSGGSDRFGLWGMASDIAFRPTVQGVYTGPLGTPHWVFGTGLGQYPILTAEHGHISYILGAEVHNDWFQAFLELGPLGFLLLVGLAGSSFWYAWKARSKGMMIAALGGVTAWIASTQTDFMTMRVYGVLWTAAVLAMIRSEAAVPTLVTLPVGMEWRAVGRRIFGVALLWIAVSYAISMNVDHTLFTALKERNRPLNEVSSEAVASYDAGMGKYLLYTGFSELSNALAGMTTTDPLVYRLQDSVSHVLLAMHPNDLVALARLREAYARLNDTKKFMEINDRYLQLRPEDADSWRLRGEALLISRDTAAGVQAVEKALSIAPANAASLRKMIEIEEARGRHREALVLMDRYLAAKPDDMTVRLFKSQTELLVGDSTAAARTAYEAMKFDSTSADARLFWSQRISEHSKKNVLSGQ